MARKLRVFSPEKPNDLVPAEVFTATIISVDAERYEMEIRSPHLAGTSMPLEIPSLFMNIRDGSGAGLHFIPEVGAEVWICKTSDGTLVPLSYHGAIGESYKNNRPTGVPGDIVMSTSDGNSITIGKGGAITISSSPVCHMMFSPIDDAIYTMSREIKSYCNASAQEFLCNEGRRTVSTYKYFEEADQNEPSTQISIGYTGTEYTYISDVNVISADNVVSYYIKDVGDIEYKSNNATVTTKDLTLTTENVVSDNLDITVSNQNVSWDCEDFHLTPTLATVGDKANADFVVNSTEFLSDLNAVLVELSKIVTVGEALLTLVGPSLPPPAGPVFPNTPQFNALVPDTAPLTNMINQIAASVYPTNKLKSE